MARWSGASRARAQPVDGLRHELLAGPRFAPDQDRGARRRRLLDDVVHLPDLRAEADHLAEGPLLAQLSPQHFDLVQGLVAFDDVVEQNLEPLQVDRLGEVVVGAFFHRLDRGLHRPLRGQQQRRHVRALRLQGAQQPQAVEAWHHQIRDHDRRPERGDLLERFFTIRGGLGQKPPVPDQLLETDPRRPVVLDDEHSLGRAGARLGGGRHVLGHQAQRIHVLFGLHHVIFTF